MNNIDQITNGIKEAIYVAFLQNFQFHVSKLDSREQFEENNLCFEEVVSFFIF